MSNATTIYSPLIAEDAYLRETPSMNLLKSNYPAAVVIPGSESDLRKAVVFASQNRIRVVVRCSGHDFNGRSTGRDVMLIKTERFKSISYDTSSKVITFGSGCNHGDIYSFLEPYGRLYVGGQSKSVCPAGCLAGGCHGLLSRQFGLGSDSITEIRIMLFNGTVVTATRNANSALFHAYLGAGQNAFGIALSFKARTYPSPPQLYELNAIFSLVDPAAPANSTAPTDNVLSTFFMNATWWRSLPRGLSGNIFVLSSGYVVIKWFYTAADYATGYAATVPLLTSKFVAQVSDPKSHTSMAALAESNYPSAAELWQRQFITNVLVPPNQAVLDGFIAATLASRPDYYMWFVFGGAVSQGTTGSASPGMRTAMYELLFGSQWHDPAADYENMLAVQMATPLVYPVCPYSYNNELTTWSNALNVIPDWKTRFYKDYSKLLTVKKKYDPCNMFTAEYGVGSDLAVATCKVPGFASS